MPALKKNPEDAEAFRDHIRSLWTHGLVGDKAQLKEARSELQRIHSVGALGDVCNTAYSKAFADELCERYTALRAPTDRARGLMLLTDSVWSLRSGTERLVDIALEAVLDPTASVRMAAVYLCGRLSFHFYLAAKDDKEGAPHRARLTRVRELVLQHAPKEWLHRSPFDPVVVPKLKPSVAKSLLLVWNEWASVSWHSDTFIDKHPDLALPFPAEWYIEPEDEEEDGYESLRDVADDMWDGGVPLSTQRALATLERQGTERLRAMLARIQGHNVTVEKALKAVRTSFEEEDSHVMEGIMFELGNAIRQRGGLSEHLYDVSRGLHAAMAHMQLNTHDGKPYSPCVVGAYTRMPLTHIKRIHEIPERLCAARNALHALHDKLIREEREAWADVEEILGPRKDEHVAHSEERFRELFDIADSALDWYAQLRPGDLIKKTPEQVACIAVHAVLYINERELPVRRYIALDTKKLGAYGGWKGAAGDISLYLRSDLRQEFEDGVLFALTPDPEFDEVPIPAPSHVHDHTHDTSFDPRDVIGTAPDSLDPKEFELRLALLFERHGLNSEEGMRTVKALVYAADDGGPKYMQRYHDNFIALFDDSHLAIDERGHFELVATATDAWNAFPHKSLGGKSPLDMIREHTRRDKK